MVDTSGKMATRSGADAKFWGALRTRNDLDSSSYSIVPNLTKLTLEVSNLGAENILPITHQSNGVSTALGSRTPVSS